MENWLACDLTYQDGRVKRFGPDEADEGDIAKDAEFATQIPGGDASGSVVLPRPPKLRADDAALFSQVRMYGPGGRSYYTGNVVGIPQVGPSEIRMELEGPVAELDYDKFFRCLYLSRDVSRWGEPSRQRQIDLLTGGVEAISGPSTVPDKTTGLPALLLTTNRGFGSGDREWAEAWFDGGYPEAIGDLYYAWEILPTSATAVTWELYFTTDEDDVGTGGSTSADQFGSLTGSEYLSDDLGAAPVPGRWASVRVQQQADTSGTQDRKFFIGPLIVIGNHGIDLVEGTDGLPAILGSDIVAHALSSGDFSFSYSTGPSGSIQPSTYGIPEADFSEGTMRRSVIEAVTEYGGVQEEPNDWGVYDGEFFWRSPGSYGRTWRVRRDEFAEPTSEGPDAAERFGKVVVTYTDASGASHSVGPPGSGAEFEDASLEDTDPSNPARDVTEVKDAGSTYLELATKLGQEWLTEANRLQRRGSLVCKGVIKDSAGNEYPAAMMRAGDRVVVEDDEDPSEEPINSTSFSQADLQVTASVGAHPLRTDVIVARLRAATERGG